MHEERNKEVYGFVRTEGRRLVNGRGEPLLLRGVGFGSWMLPEGYMWRFPEAGDRPRRIEAMIESLVGLEQAEAFWTTYYDRYIAEDDIARIAEEGFNSVRVPINARFLTGEGATTKDAGAGAKGGTTAVAALMPRDEAGSPAATANITAEPMAMDGRGSAGALGDKSMDGIGTAGALDNNTTATASGPESNSLDDGEAWLRAVAGNASETDSPLALREDRLKLLDRVIGWCRTHRLYVILDLHGAPGGQTGTNIDDSEFDRPELFTDESRAREAVAIWRALAERYKDEWIVAGYDLLNEPLPDWFGAYNDRVMPLYREMIQAIREVDERHMIILEGVHWSTDWSIFENAFGDEPIDRNVLLQFHKYWNNPDTESIAKYLDLRERWNVPIFMGEGGENNKDWYAGAFRMFDDHNISWNFWTWKKIDTNNSPCSIRKPEGWERLVDFLQGGDKPEPAVAQRILREYLDNMTLANCDYRPEVVRSLLRRAPVRIPAVFYGYKGEDVSYGFGEHNRMAKSSADQPESSSVGFREADGTAIRFMQTGRETATFAHGGGEEWKPDEWLCLELAEGEWCSYSFDEDSGLRQLSEVSIALELQGVNEGGSLLLELDGEPVKGNIAVSGDWKAYGDYPLGKLGTGRHELTLRCNQGSVRAAWLLLDRR